MATIVVVVAAIVEVEAAIVEVVRGGTVSGAAEQATTTASIRSRNLDAVIGSMTHYEHSDHRHLDVLGQARKLVSVDIRLDFETR